MSTTALPGNFRVKQRARGPQAVLPEMGVRPLDRIVRRRGSLAQGFALETLGHAVEYLVDSRMLIPSGSDARADQQAIQILMGMSRSVFAECPEVISWRRRLRGWLAAQ